MSSVTFHHWFLKNLTIRLLFKLINISATGRTGPRKKRIGLVSNIYAALIDVNDFLAAQLLSKSI